MVRVFAVAIKLHFNYQVQKLNNRGHNSAVMPVLCTVKCT